MAIIKTENLWKIYKTEADTIEAIKGISLELQKGEFCLLMGASGSGKSTLLHIMGTLDKPTRGRVIFDGEDLSHMKEKELTEFRNKKLGFVFQFHYLINELTVLENVMIPLLIKGENFNMAKKKAKETLKLVGLENRMLHRPSEISGGEQQRAAVARAIVNSPVLVLADEPTGNLDSKSTTQLINTMLELREKFETTFFVATHNRELEKFADRVYFIKDGKLAGEQEISKHV